MCRDTDIGKSSSIQGFWVELHTNSCYRLLQRPSFAVSNSNPATVKGLKIQHKNITRKILNGDDRYYKITKPQSTWNSTYLGQYYKTKEENTACIRPEGSEDSSMEKEETVLVVVLIRLLEDPSLGRSSAVRGHGHKDAILHLLGGKRELLVHDGVEVRRRSLTKEGADAVSSGAGQRVVQVLELLAGDHAAGSAERLADVAQGPNHRNDHVGVLLPEAAILAKNETTLALSASF
jgi:hypothetical protein